MSEHLCRIVTYETSTGTNYIAERRVWKNRWFSESGYEWEAFVKLERGKFSHEGFKVLQSYEKSFSKFRNKSYAECACEEWERVMSSGRVIKTWSIDETETKEQGE